MHNPVKLIIAEDEAPLRASFAKQLTRTWPQAELVAVCADGEAAVRAIHQHQPHVAFLDIRMPKKTGLQVAKDIGDRAFVVFTTAYDKYAIDAFESGAVDYLLKPVEDQRLADTVARLQQRLSSQSPPNLQVLIEQIQAKLSPSQQVLNWVTASVGDVVKMIAVDDILYFASEQKYTKVVTACDQAIIRTPLKELITRLDQSRFVQVHRSAIVALDAIHSIKKNELGTWQLRLRHNDDVLPVSKEFQRRFRAL